MSLPVTWPPGFLLIHLPHLAPKQSWAMFLLYRCARCFAPLHRGAGVASASRSAKRRSGVGTFSPNRTSWRPLRSFIPEGAETGDGVADDERIHLACTDDFDLCPRSNRRSGT